MDEIGEISPDTSVDACVACCIETCFPLSAGSGKSPSEIPVGGPGNCFGLDLQLRWVKDGGLLMPTNPKTDRSFTI